MSNHSSGSLPFDQKNQSFPAFYLDTIKPLTEAQKMSENGLDFFMRIGGLDIRIIFTSEELHASMTPALGHLRIETLSPPHLTIYGWDSAAKNVSLPINPWLHESLILSRDTQFTIKEGLHVSLNRNSRILSLYDEKSRSGIFWAENGSNLPFHDKASPFRTILQWFMYKHGRLCVHSAAVSFLNKGVLLAGHEMSGKSTTSLLCLLEGMDFAGDDYVAIGENARYHAYSLFSSAKLDPDNIIRMPELVSKISNKDRLDSEKAVIFLHEYFPARIAGSFPLSALLLPKITGAKNSSISEATPADGIRALAPTTIFLQAGIRKEAFSFLTRFVRRIPCYHLELGTDYRAIPETIKDFVTRI